MNEWMNDWHEIIITVCIACLILIPAWLCRSYNSSRWERGRSSSPIPNNWLWFLRSSLYLDSSLSFACTCSLSELYWSNVVFSFSTNEVSSLINSGSVLLLLLLFLLLLLLLLLFPTTIEAISGSPWYSFTKQLWQTSYLQLLQW